VDQILLTSQLLASGYGKDELRRLERRGELAHVRRGSWARILPDSERLQPEEQHRRLVTAVSARVGADAVVSHGSAAVLHALPTWPTARQRVHLTRSRSTGAQRRSDVEMHSATLPASQVTEVDGLAVTSMARTVADLGRTLSFDQAVAAGDRAAARGLDFGELDAVLESMRRWPGVAQARRVADFLDSRAESAGESVSRVRLCEAGLPCPIPQREIYDDQGTMIARVDFAWEQYRTIGEFDGKVKYGDLLAPGQLPSDVLFAEKLREDALRDAGWQVVRWVWADLDRPTLLRDKVLRAFARTGSRR
jgi:hypothetical protein